MVALAGASLTPMTGVTSVGTGATTPMTATALAREEVVAAAGERIKSVFAWLLLCFYPHL